VHETADHPDRSIITVLTVPGGPHAIGAALQPDDDACWQGLRKSFMAPSA
jgi:hypothetical protein